MCNYTSTYQKSNNFFGIDRIGQALNGKRNGKGGFDLCDCPAHGGKECLSVDPDDNGNIVVHCFAGCSFAAVTNALRGQGLWPAFGDGGKTTAEQAAEKIASRRKREAKQADNHKKAAAKAGDIYRRVSNGSCAAAHPYAMKKNLDFGPLVRRGGWPQRGWQDALIVPLFDEALAQDAPVTLQAISPDGNKDFLVGGRKKGCFHILGQPANGELLYIGEGLATVAAVHNVTGLGCLVACDAPNLPPVAETARRLWPTAKIVVLEDNDEAGRKFAASAARAVEGKVARAVDGLSTPKDHGDFWDVLHECGNEAVRNALNQAREPETQREKTQNQGGAGAEREASEKATDPTSGEEAAQAALDREIARLATLTPVRYEQERKTVAKTLDIRAGILDRMVKAKKGKTAPASDDLPFEETVPCPGPVNPAELLDDIEKTIGRFIRPVRQPNVGSYRCRQSG